MDMQSQTNMADIQDLDFSQLLFRQIDRIQLLSQKNYSNNSDKLFDFTWSVRLLCSLIPNEIRTTDFKTKYETINKERKELKQNQKTTFVEEFEKVEELFNLAIDLLASKGLLYKRISNGTTEGFKQK